MDKSQSSVSNFFFINFLKGLGMGAANIIPGVSGGTIALITGIFERIIHAIKSFNLTALRLLLQRRFKEFATYVDLWFMVSVGSGVFVSLITLAKLLGYLFDNYPVPVWAYFFGLILASVYFVGKAIEKWDFSVILLFIIGTLFALSFTFSTPLRENNTIVYNLICGAIAACSMILPGLSGSFVLLLMGNYRLIMIEAISTMDFSILLPVGIGAIAGLLLFSHLLSWVFRKYKNQTLSLLTGFILGSLAVIWPWKNVVETYIDRHGVMRPLIQKNIWPTDFQGDPQIFMAIILFLTGIITIFVLESKAEKSSKE